MNSIAMSPRTRRPSAEWLVLSILGWAIALGALTWIVWIHPVETEAAVPPAQEITADDSATNKVTGELDADLPSIEALAAQRLATERELIQELMTELEAAERKAIRLEAELSLRRAVKRDAELGISSEDASSEESADETAAGPMQTADLGPVVLEPPLFWTDAENCNCVAVRGKIRNATDTPISGYVLLELFDADRKVIERRVAMTLEHGTAQDYSVDLRPQHIRPRGFNEDFSVRVAWES